MSFRCIIIYEETITKEHGEIWREFFFLYELLTYPCYCLQGVCVLEFTPSAVQESKCSGGHLQKYDSLSFHPVLPG